MALFGVSVATVLLVSAACSLSEAALYSVKMPYIRQLVDAGSRSGKMLARFKLRMDTPITACRTELVESHSSAANLVVLGSTERLLEQAEGKFFLDFPKLRDVLFVSAQQRILIE